jgi:Reverse transcriptase (RNA-dependent DNA polymerase)
MTTEEDNELKRFILENIKSGKIKSSKGSITSPLLFVRKKEETLRICVNYRQIKDYVCTDAYPLPRIDTVLKNISGYNWFTRLDLRDAYHQLRMHPDSEWLTTVSSKYGSYSVREMSFGLLVAPSYFQRFVNEILEKFFVKDVIAYLDDILIPSKTLKDNIELTHKVIEKPLKHNLRAKIQKCEFFARTTQFLGYKIGSSSLGIKEGAVTTIKKWLMPKTIHDMQSLLGFTNFFRQFIRNYSEAIRPLQETVKGNLDRKGRKLILQMDNLINAFKRLKTIFFSFENTYLYLPHQNDQLVLKADASLVASGAILLAT